MCIEGIATTPSLGYQVFDIRHSPCDRHDDEVGLINMNGRIFDPAIGRFLNADPTLQAPTYMQAPATRWLWPDADGHRGRAREASVQLDWH